MKNLFTLVRIYVPPTIHDSKRHSTTHVVPDFVWNYVAENHKNWHIDGVKLLYMTHRHLQDDTSLIIDTKNSDLLADFLTGHIASLENVRGIHVINLAKMRFFRPPEESLDDFSRFTIAIDVMPQNMNDLYEEISALKPGKDIFINYIANTFQSYDASILISILARSRDHAEAFVNEYIRPLVGVMGTTITLISKTMRLVTAEEWLESVGPFFFSPKGEHIRDIDARDDSLIAGC